MSNYTFISPIKANRDALAGRLRAKGAVVEEIDDTTMLRVMRLVPDPITGDLEAVEDRTIMPFQIDEEVELAEDEVVAEVEMGDGQLLEYALESDVRP